MSDRWHPVYRKVVLEPGFANARAQFFYAMMEITVAHVLMLMRQGIIDLDQGRAVLAACQQVMEEGPEAVEYDPRYEDLFFKLEAEMARLAGDEAVGNMHVAMSRNDMDTAMYRIVLRQEVLDVLAALTRLRAALLDKAAEHVETVMVAHTHNQQAQPTTLAHYLLALDAALARSAIRLRAAYQHVNQGPLGAAALTTSSFALDRRRLAALLGFAGVVENAYDANHLAPVDIALEVAAALGIAAVQVGQFAQDLHAQYAAATPWITLQRGELVGVSSIMPQKRNPAALEQLRVQSSVLLGEMQAVALLAHNVRTGMFDYRAYDPVPSSRALGVFALLRKVAEGLVVDKERALAEVHADYSTATELADALLQRADVPFRVGHEFASALTDFGRSQRLSLREIPYREASRIYEAMTDRPLPLDAQAIAEILSPEFMVFGRKGLGGPQLAEADRMLSAQQQAVAADAQWALACRSELAQADARLHAAVTALAAAA